LATLSWSTAIGSKPWLENAVFEGFVNIVLKIIKTIKAPREAAMAINIISPAVI
jgi:hypothetical protein